MIWSMFTMRMLPKRRLSRFTPKPLKTLNNVIPPARPSCRKTATAASPEIFVERSALLIPMDPNTTVIPAIHNGKKPTVYPSANPPKAVCDNPSPMSEIFFRTIKTLRIELRTAMMMAMIKAR